MCSSPDWPQCVSLVIFFPLRLGEGASGGCSVAAVVAAEIQQLYV